MMNWNLRKKCHSKLLHLTKITQNDTSRRCSDIFLYNRHMRNEIITHVLHSLQGMNHHRSLAKLNEKGKNKGRGKYHHYTLS